MRCKQISRIEIVRLKTIKTQVNIFNKYLSTLLKIVNKLMKVNKKQNILKISKFKILIN